MREQQRQMQIEMKHMRYEEEYNRMRLGMSPTPTVRPLTGNEVMPVAAVAKPEPKSNKKLLLIAA